MPLTIDFTTSFYFHGEGPGVAFGGREQTLDEVAPHIEARLPLLAELPIQASWSGFYEISPDHNAIVGEAPEVSRFLYATGFSGHGFQQAPAVGEHLAELVAGGTTDPRSVAVRARPLRPRGVPAGDVRHLMRLFVVARHAESTLNVERRVNGDPTRPVGLTDRGRLEASELGVQLAGIPIDVCVHTRFPRTRETAELVLAGREIPFVVEPLLDDIKIGELDGEPLETYRAWKHGHPRSVPFPGGESLDQAALRFADGLEAVVGLDAQVVFVVTHEIPLRYALNGAGGSDELDGPMHEIANATPYVFDEPRLERAVARIRELTPAP